MADALLTSVIRYSVYLAEVGLFLYLVLWRHCRQLVWVCLYVAALLLTDAGGRSYVLYRYGAASREYFYFYYVTDILLALAAFLVICSMFQRACSREQKMWGTLRLVLTFAFLLVLTVSYLSLSHNFPHLITRFVTEFEQNLFFTCLVLNTVLYILMQHIENRDNELGLLVCGMGVQFAGPAASLAFAVLTSKQHRSLLNYVNQLCTLGMLLIWYYAVRVPKGASVQADGNKVRPLAETCGAQSLNPGGLKL